MKLKSIAYGVGSLGTALAYQTFTNRIQFRYIDEIGVPVGVISVVWFFYGIWNAVNDPLMGQLSDGTRTRWGRRIPYIAFGALPLAVSFYLLWLPPAQASIPLLVAYFTVTVFAFDTLWSLLVIAWASLFPEMYPDLHERAAVSGWREVFSLIGVLVALGLSPLVIDRIGYAGMAAVFGAVVFASFMISLLGSKEDPSFREEDSIPFWQGVKIAFANPSFRWFMGANIAKEFIFLITVAMVPFWAKYVLRLHDIAGGMDAATQESLLLAVPFVLAIPAMFVWTKIIQKAGSRRAWIYTSMALLPAFVVITAAPTFTIGLIGTTLLVLGLPGLLMLYNIVLSDVIDEDELISGRRREGFYFGINGALVRLAFSAQAILLGVVFGVTHFDSALPVQPDSALWGIRFLMGGTPILACLVMMWALRRYPLHGEKLVDVRGRLAARRAASPVVP